MALAEPRPSDANELGALHLLDRGGAAITHRLAQPANELVEHVCDRALVRHAPLDPLGDQLVYVLDITLEIAVFRITPLHRGERGHPVVLLEALATGQDHLSGSLVRPSKQAPGQDRIG